MPRLKSIESDDPEFHKREYKKYLAKMKRWDKKWGNNYETFMNQLFTIFGDNPPDSWRFLITTYKYPVFRVVNKRTGKSTYFIHVCDDRLMIPHKFFMDKFKPLFENHKGLYGSAFVQIIDFSTFGPKKQSKYIEAIKEMLNQTELISLNFAAH